MKKGVIPIYIAYVLRSMQDAVVLSYREKEIPINGDMLSQIESAPGDYTFYTEKGTSEKERYLDTVIALFAPENPAHITNKTVYAVSALQAWFRSLSKFARDHAQAYQAVGITEVSKKIQKMKAQLLQYDINPHAFLFKDIPSYLESSSGKRLPISGRPAAPKRESIMAWVNTSASECPRRPCSQGIFTPPRIRSLSGANL